MSNYAEFVIDLVRTEKPDLEPELARLYALLVLITGADTSLEDVHDAWSIWKTATDPEHRSLVPFSGLSANVQELDREYQHVIESAHERMLAELGL